MGLLNIALVFVYLTVLDGEFSNTNAEREVTDNTIQTRLVLNEEMDLYAEVRALKEQIQNLTAQLHAKVSSASASTYVRWGKTKCTNVADFVYEGYIGGKRFNDPGSGSDAQCLPSDPTWNKYNTVSDIQRARIYGTEIDLSPASHVFEKDVLNEDMPCAFCRSGFQTTVMFPARNNCYTGWTLQYSGYLVSNMDYTGRGAYQSICLDKDPDFIAGGVGNDNEHVIYLTEAKCGSLPCPPYIDNAEIACAVCSK